MSWHLRADTSVAASPPVVWSVLTDFESYSEWNPTLRVRGDLKEGGRLWVLVLDRDIPPVPFRPRVTALDPGRELRWRTDLPLGTVTAEHTFRVERSPDGSRFVQTERFDGSLVDPLLRRLSASIRRTFEQMNDALAARAASVADSSPDPDRSDEDPDHR